MCPRLDSSTEGSRRAFANAFECTSCITLVKSISFANIKALVAPRGYSTCKSPPPSFELLTAAITRPLSSLMMIPLLCVISL